MTGPSSSLSNRMLHGGYCEILSSTDTKLGNISRCLLPCADRVRSYCPLGYQHHLGKLLHILDVDGLTPVSRDEVEAAAAREFQGPAVLVRVRSRLIQFYRRNIRKKPQAVRD